MHSPQAHTHECCSVFPMHASSLSPSASRNESRGAKASRLLLELLSSQVNDGNSHNTSLLCLWVSVQRVKLTHLIHQASSRLPTLSRGGKISRQSQCIQSLNYSKKWSSRCFPSTCFCSLQTGDSEHQRKHLSESAVLFMDAFALRVLVTRWFWDDSAPFGFQGSAKPKPLRENVQNQSTKGRCRIHINKWMSFLLPFFREPWDRSLSFSWRPKKKTCFGENFLQGRLFTFIFYFSYLQMKTRRDCWPDTNWILILPLGTQNITAR